MSPPSTPPESSGESRNLARGGAVSFAGSAISAILGFALTFVLTRSLGPAGAGVALQAISVFMIVLSVAKLGMDSVSLWLLPRLANHGVSEIRHTLIQLGTITVLGSVTCTAIIEVGAGIAVRSPDGDLRRVAEAVAAIAWYLPFGAVALVALAATRGLGGITTYVAIGSIGIPGVRILAVMIVAAGGGSAVALSAAWGSAFPLGAAAALVVLLVQTRRRERESSPARLFSDGVERRRSIRRYAIPRTVSAALEQSILWLDVVLVGLIASASSAGVYGGASRLIAAGLIVDTALRAVVSTRFSALLFEKKTRAVQNLYRVASTWLVLFSSPIYIVLAVFAPTVLAWFGPGFDAGASALVILCAGAIVAFTAGNIHSVLLMSGRSGLAAMNKAIALAVNVVGNVVLIPIIGIEGAAISWAASMVIDASLAAFQVKTKVGIGIDFPAIGYALLIPFITVALPAALVAIVAGQSPLTLLVALGIGGVLFVTWCILDRKRLHLDGLRTIFKRS